MSASAASWSTSSQPSSTIGAMTIASTPWLMKLRTAAICAAGSLSAALKTRSKPFSSENAFFIDSVLALRQPRLRAGLREADLDRARRRRRRRRRCRIRRSSRSLPMRTRPAWRCSRRSCLLHSKTSSSWSGVNAGVVIADLSWSSVSGMLAFTIPFGESVSDNISVTPPGTGRITRSTGRSTGFRSVSDHIPSGTDPTIAPSTGHAAGRG